ncbi:cytochrome P450 [Streptomyces hygroscopicus]|uniref:cytochrome P450 family protein n=1 Tax=Streptomyces hygroscopicus TaxID=1912 RepID=UPI0022406BC3|nr:cytochrome P450 [Streptomyces hygroscopicus]MCW7944011.1 cytochrome P450 [Streptomyces hygroscopicus]
MPAPLFGDTFPDTEIFGDAYMQDPYGAYVRLRKAGPVHQAKTPSGLPVWVVTDYEAVRAALTDGRLAKDADRMRAIADRKTAAAGGPSSVSETLAANMLNSDPPDHTRLRKLVVKAFTTRRVEQLRPRIAGITDELLDSLELRARNGQAVDLIKDFAFPVPIAVICELLGIPLAERETFRAWSKTLVGAGPREDVRHASMAMGGYLMQVIAAKRAQPSDDLLSDLIQVSDDGDRLDRLEVVSMTMLLLVAGHETTVNLIGNGILALLRHDDQRAALRADESLIRGAVEELLRYDGPAPMATMRFTAEPVEIGGVTIPAGEIVFLGLAAANRDGSRFDRPDELDITRPIGGHLGFGFGIHHCVGAPLARLEAEVTLGKFLRRFPDARLAVSPGALRWRSSVIMRGLESLPTTLALAGRVAHADTDTK